MRLPIVALSALALGAPAFAFRLPLSAVGRRSTALRAVWSNPQAVEDYQNYLNGVEEVVSKDQASVFVCGSSEASKAMAKGLAGFNAKGNDVVLDGAEAVGSGLPAQVDGREDYPIYICVPNNEVEKVLQLCPDEKKEDLLILQDGGMLEPMLKRYGVGGKRQSQALCYFKFHPVSGKAIDYIVDLGLDVRGDPKYAAATTVTGKWAGAMTERLQRNGLHCEDTGYYEFRRVMIERNLYEVIFSIVGLVHNKSTMGEVGDFYEEEIDDMLRSFDRCIRGHLSTPMLYGVLERVRAIGGSVKRHGDYNRDVADEDWPWFHGYWMTVHNMYAKSSMGPPVPMWKEYMDYAVDKGMVKLPKEETASA